MELWDAAAGGGGGEEEGEEEECFAYRRRRRKRKNQVGLQDEMKGKDINERSSLWPFFHFKKQGNKYKHMKGAQAVYLRSRIRAHAQIPGALKNLESYEINDNSGKTRKKWD